MAEEGYKVILNVYDLSQGLAQKLSTAFLGKVIEGIWHTGIVVYGNEYFFGAGVQHLPAGATPYGNPIRTVDLGFTHVPKDVFEMYLDEIRPRYTAETYSLMTHNCNNFTNEVAQFLVSATIPEYILNLPNEVMSSPMGSMIMPMIQNLETTMRSGAVPQTPQFRPTPPVRPAATSRSTLTPITPPDFSSIKSDGVKSKPESTSKASELVESPAVKPQAQPSSADPLGNARSRVQEEITTEFATLMAMGKHSASEAAALAARRVMQRHGHLDSAMPQS